MRNWRMLTRQGDWRTFADVRAIFHSADPVDGLVVFDIAHNRYRLVTHINYTTHRVYIHEILTHAEYDRKTEKEWKRDPYY